MRVGIYARYSSELQRATSIDDQVAKAKQHAETHGWLVLPEHIYADAGLSGASLDDRPQMRALLSTVECGPRPFDILLVDDSSRVARDLPDAIRFLQRLKFYGVQVIYVSQNIDSASDQAETLIAVHGVVDSLYLKELGKKTRRGLEGQVSRGYATGGRTFGYTTTDVPDPTGKLDNGRPALLGRRIAKNEAEAATVRRIFERYASGAGIGTVVEELNRSKTSGPRGEPWRYNSVRRVLRNERYRGFQLWNQRTFVRRPGTRQKVARPVPRTEWHTHERRDLRIVSDDLWNRVQSRFTEISGLLRRQSGSNLIRGRNGTIHSRHLFSGLMRCDVCGGVMGVVAGGHGSPRYGCQQSWRNGVTTCANRLTVRVKVADAELLSGLQARLLHPHTVAYVTESVTARVAAELDDGPRRQQQLESELAKLQSELDNLVAGLANDGPTPSVMQAIRARDRDLERLQRDLDGVHEPLADKLAILPSWVQRQLADVAGLLREAPDQVRTHLRRIGVGFTVSPVCDEGRPFLRATGTADLLVAAFGRQFDFPASERSRPRSGP